ncbi:MAG: threonine--tRNA ligase [Candidatus Aenigmatarchaeota archaeon]|nr:MAG: threonine--tRNA ligase [Candidatus Aenigmarchaeota archaeon]
MKILTLHSNSLTVTPTKKAIKDADEEHEALTAKEALVVFTSVEKEDEKNNDVVERTVEEILKVNEQVHAKEIVIYPYVHLTNAPSSPGFAKETLNRLTAALGKHAIVKKASFGWYKAFTIDVKGHPLAELSREIKGEAEKKRAPIKKEYFIMTEDGKTHDPGTYKYKQGEENFKILVDKEALGKEAPGGKEPEYIKHVKRFGIDWESMSDSGHMRYGPLGAMILELASDYANAVVRSVGIPVYNVRGTNMFSLNERAIAEHAKLFGDRLYELEMEKKRFVLRYAACFQQFAIMKDWIISYKNIPLGAFEVADSYRFEQSGETLLCFRLRKFQMPDMHVLTSDMEEAKKWTLRIHDKIYGEIGKLGRDYYSLYNLTSKEYFEKNKEFFKEMVRREKKPVLLCFYPQGVNYYWMLNVEYHIVDSMQRPREIGTVQIDVGNAERFGITYTDASGAAKHPIILHTAIIGGLERYIYTIFDTALREKHPTLPLWLSPTQVRLCPVNDTYAKKCEALAEELEKKGVRADVDDRTESVQKKVRDAETDWIPLIVVYGEKEDAAKKLAVRFRKSGDVENMSLVELASRIRKETSEYPFRPLTMPKLVSKRPKF